MLIVVHYDVPAGTYTAVVHRDEVPPTLWSCAREDRGEWKLVGVLAAGRLAPAPECFSPNNAILAKLDEAADVLDAAGTASSVSRWPT